MLTKQNIVLLFKAGISEGKLTIALEPEAASVYCRYLPLQATNQEQSSAISDFQVGIKYMIVDAGGESDYMQF